MVSRPWHPGLPSRKRICDIRLPEGVMVNALVYGCKAVDGYRKVRVLATEGTMVVWMLEELCEWQPIEVPARV